MFFFSLIDFFTLFNKSNSLLTKNRSIYHSDRIHTNSRLHLHSTFIVKDLKVIARLPSLSVTVGDALNKLRKEFHQFCFVKRPSLKTNDAQLIQIMKINDSVGWLTYEKYFNLSHIFPSLLFRSLQKKRIETRWFLSVYLSTFF